MLRISTAHVLTFAVFAIAGSACTIDGDGTESQLDRLRVLGLQSDMPDLAAGDQTRLSALVHDPHGRTITYEWSWCPRRGDTDDGFACLMEETSLRTAWDELGTGLSLPSYDLGTAQTATFANVVSPELAVPLCQALTREAADPDTELFLCLSELELSFRLRIASGTDDDVAIRSVGIVADGAARNFNPNPAGDLTLTFEDGTVRAPGQPLLGGAGYDITVGFGPEQSQMFQPEPEDGIDDPEPRNETLYLSWFVTSGVLESSSVDDTFNDVETADALRTSFLDGGNFDALREVRWFAGPPGQSVTLYLVLRDERGGLSFIEHDLGVLENE